MKYMNGIAGVMLTFFLFVTACSNGEQVKEISHIELGAFKKYTGTYVENNTDVLAIVKNLPGGEIVKPTLEQNKLVYIQIAETIESDILRYGSRQYIVDLDQQTIGLLF